MSHAESKTGQMCDGSLQDYNRADSFLLTTDHIAHAPRGVVTLADPSLWLCQPWEPIAGLGKLHGRVLA